MPDEFVRNDVFAENAKGVGQRFDDIKEIVSQSIQRMEAVMDKSQARNEAAIAAMRGDIRAMDTKIGAMGGMLSQNVTVTGLIVMAFGILITIVIAAIQMLK